jgi:hypothetical protein
LSFQIRGYDIPAALTTLSLRRTRRYVPMGIPMPLTGVASATFVPWIKL